MSEDTVNEDLETMYAYVCLERGINPASIFLFGRSLGSCPSTHLAALLTSTRGRDSNMAKVSSEGMLALFNRIR